MVSAILFVILFWLLMELIIFAFQAKRYGVIHATKSAEDRILTSTLGIAFGMLVAVCTYLKLQYY